MRAKIEIFARSGDTLGEGPVWSADEQALYWIDIAHRQLRRKGWGGHNHQSWSLPDYPGCLALFGPGQIALAMGDGVQRLDIARSALDRVASTPRQFAGTRFNDGKVDPRGRFWAGTMQNNFAENGTVRTVERDLGALYRFDPDGQVHMMADTLGIPNGLTWAPDGRRFYMADSAHGAIFDYDFDIDAGALGGRAVLFDGADFGIPDGATIDVDGCLWSARWDGHAILRITPSGNVDRVVEMPVPRPTSCVFGGPDLRTLLVTSASMGLSAAELATYPNSGAVFAVEDIGQGLAIPPFGSC
ncbi:L-arabinonolactonase [Bradyrhizobium sp. S3.12.5]|uniref:SMP-30/gluconolactonase/LRE family protein n=1 Tax=Bradyrhizobium sp. S3.12.5 TaxID=3156386 RepID=UPI003398CDF6